MLNVLYSVIVGFVQGIAEWIPVSSKTQVLLVSNLLFGINAQVGLAFGLFMEIGSIGSAIIYFRRDLASLLHDRGLVVYLVVVTVVTGVAGVPLYLLAEHLLQGAYNVGIPMAILGLFLILDGFYIRSARRLSKIGGLVELKMKHFVVLGIAQGLAALPGVSRSGMTVSTMLFMGVDPKEAFKLSYLAYIPAALGGLATTLLFSKGELSTAISIVNPAGVLIASVVALVVGVLVISLLLRFAGRNDIYVVTLAVGLLAIALAILSSFGSA